MPPIHIGILYTIAWSNGVPLLIIVAILFLKLGNKNPKISL